MAATGGIHILTDRKAKIMTLLKASLKDAEKAAKFGASEMDVSDARKSISGNEYTKVYDETSAAFADSLDKDTAIVLYDDYVSILFEDCDVSGVEVQAASYSEIFGKPAVFSVVINDEALVFGVAYGGNVCTRLVCGDNLDEYGLGHEEINMDYLIRFYNDAKVTNLNALATYYGEDCVSDILYAVEEDYGIRADISPISIPLFGDQYKLLEKSRAFCVWSTISDD